MTAPGDRPSLEDVLAAARADFIVLAENALARLSDLAAHVDGPDSDSTLEAVWQEFHRVHGSAGTFGFPRISRQASAAQLVVKRWRHGGGEGARRAIVEQVIDVMREELTFAPDEPRRDQRRVLLSGIPDDAATELAVHALEAGFVVERLFTGELDEALADGQPFAVVTGPDAASATAEAIVARLVVLRGAH